MAQINSAKQATFKEHFFKHISLFDGKDFVRQKTQDINKIRVILTFKTNLQHFQD